MRCGRSEKFYDILSNVKKNVIDLRAGVTLSSMIL